MGPNAGDQRRTCRKQNYLINKSHGLNQLTQDILEKKKKTLNFTAPAAHQENRAPVTTRLKLVSRGHEMNTNVCAYLLINYIHKASLNMIQ